MSPDLAVENGTVCRAPGAAAERRATVVIRGGRVAKVGTNATVPSDVEVVDADGRTVVPGFWNCHVHFTEPRWASAATAPREALERGLREMLTRWGFTTVVDLGSDPRSTLPLRRRIESGEIGGPAILTAGPAIYPPGGIPYYVRDSIPPDVVDRVPQPADPEAAAAIAREILALGADVLKLFTGSYVARGTIRPMSEPVARAVADVAHAAGRRVFSHPSNLEGTQVAMRAGVDVLAHPPDTAEGVDASRVREIVSLGVSMTPTLKMFAATVSRSAAYLDPILEIVREFRTGGGELLFGTDVGYLTDYSTEEEFGLLERVGLDGPAILRMLTTAPAGRFPGAGPARLEPGAPGDLVLLDGDPMADPSAFARVRLTVRSGRVVYRST